MILEMILGILFFIVIILFFVCIIKALLYFLGIDLEAKYLNGRKDDA